MSKYHRVIMAAAVATVVAACANEAVETTQSEAVRARSSSRGGGSGRGTRTVARPCRADSIAVDVPLFRDTPAGFSNAAFVSNVQAALATHIAATGTDWFCGAGEIVCPSGSVGVVMQSVLPNRAWPAVRADGHRRFWRIGFSSSDVASLSVRPDKACDAVQAVRATIAAVAGAVPDDDFFVGRECDASIASAQGAPSPQMSTWHLQALGLPPTTLVAAPPLASQQVDLAQIDTGVFAAVASSNSGIGVASTRDQYLSAAQHHPHGTAMAILARQVAPLTALHVQRALDGGGSGTSRAVALALDDAMFGPNSGDPRRPLVLSLSFGWPAELGRVATISSPTCVSHESPFGGPVRYLLDVGRRMDDAGDRAVFVSAATGNRPLPVDPALFPAGPSSVPLPTCTPAPIGAELFFPAEWHRIDSCRPNDPSGHRVAFAVGAVDDQHRETQVAIADAETPLVAPGQHVYATHPAAAPTPVTAACNAGPTLANFESLPRAFTGSSVSAALVAAAAARVQDRRLSARKSPLRRDPLGRLLYLTGRSLCRDTSAGVPMRLLDVARLDHAIDHCPTLVTCAQVLAGADPIPSGAVASCAGPLVACGLETFAGQALAPNCAVASSPVPWPSAYHAVRGVCHSETVSGAWKSKNSCGGSCPYEQGAYRSLVGSLGPLPSNPTCPDCPMQIGQLPVSKLVFVFELSPDFEPGTTFGKPVVEIVGYNPTIAGLDKFYLPLPNNGKWAPGEHLELTVGVEQLDIDWSQPKMIEAGLVVAVTAPGAKYPVADFSALRVEP